MKCIAIQVYGKVQGVWYRASTKKKADELGLKGIVQNETDGSVFIKVTGENSLLQALIEWCKEGPQFAKVSSVEVHDIDLKSFADFQVIR